MESGLGRDDAVRDPVPRRRPRRDGQDSAGQERVAVLGRHRVGYAVETTAAAAVWFARMPGDAAPLVRPLTLRDEGVAALWPLRHAPAGWPGVRSATVRRGCSRPRRRGLRRSFMSTRSRSARPRTSWCSRRPAASRPWSCTCWGIASFPATGAIFSIQEGARFMVEAMGGIYQGYDDLALNPLDVGPDARQPPPRGRGVEDDDGGRQRVPTTTRPSHAADSLARSAGADPERDLRAAFTRRTPLRRAMAAWVTDGGGRRGHRARDERAPRWLGVLTDRTWSAST